MSKKFDAGILLLPLGYALFAVVLFVAFRPMYQYDFHSEEKVRASFDQYFEEFDQVSRILWGHPDYFADLYEKTDVRGLIFNTGDTLEKGNSAGYLTEEEWNRTKALCALVKPYEIYMRSHDGAAAVEWVFAVQGSDGEFYSLDLYYIRALDASTPEQEQAAIENAAAYFGRFKRLLPIEGKDFWYECVIIPNSQEDPLLEESLPIE